MKDCINKPERYCPNKDRCRKIREELTLIEQEEYCRQLNMLLNIEKKIFNEEIIDYSKHTICE